MPIVQGPVTCSLKLRSAVPHPPPPPLPPARLPQRRPQRGWTSISPLLRRRIQWSMQRMGQALGGRERWTLWVSFPAITTVKTLANRSTYS
ncbi:hypothetical protein BDN71DRAFT_1451030 [Pleurotus eryngii]|uniref:Uncharacterized protein n=1 Tax=Pleurotus eryngii TaxID=5323 RepID=A0A9P5ZUS7_PLEER|nr:hypothetical protein BDN71DRAFT_1451030 [Pleurotus eryngii]